MYTILVLCYNRWSQDMAMREIIELENNSDNSCVKRGNQVIVNKECYYHFVTLTSARHYLPGLMVNQVFLMNEHTVVWELEDFLLSRIPSLLLTPKEYRYTYYNLDWRVENEQTEGNTKSVFSIQTL